MNANQPDVVLALSRHVSLRVDGESRRLSPTQQAYLLLVCHAEGRGARRDDVIQLLWEDEDNRSTRHRVRQLNYSLTRKAGTEVVQADGPWLTLAGTVRVDWDGTRFWESMEAPTPGYQEHLSLLGAARIRAEEKSAVRDLDAARLADSPEGVIRALEDGRRPPGAWRDLLWALLRTGRIREAEFELQKILGDDLPAEAPSLARRLVSEADRLLGLAAAGAQEALVLRGRSEETLRLQELVLSNHPCVLLTGDQGVGRSRLLGQAVAFVLSNREDVVVLSATGSPSERTRPFGGLEQLLDEEILVQAFAELGQPETEVIRQALPVQFHSDESHVIATLGGPGSYLRIAQAVGKLFERAYGEADIVFFVDDFQDLDRSSREVITRLILVSNSRLLGTWCTGDADHHAELLFRFRDLSPQLVHLRDLPMDQATGIVRDLVPDIDGKDAEEVAQISGGRPGRIVELVRALDGPPVLSGPVVPNLDQLLRRRLRGLDPAVQEALVFLSVHGGRMPVNLLCELLGAGILEAAGLLRELERARLIHLEGETAAMAPGMLRQFVYRELPDGIRQDRHGRVAEALLHGSREPDPGVIAHHLDEAGQPVRASEWYRRAGEDARERTAYAEAILLLEKSLSTGEVCPPDVARSLGTLHSGMADFRRSVHWFQLARMGFSEAGDVVGDIECVLEETQVLLFRGDPLPHLTQALREQYARAETLGLPDLVGSCLELGLSVADFHMSKLELDWCVTHLLEQLNQFPSEVGLSGVGARLTYLGAPNLGLQLAKRSYLASRADPSRRLESLRRLVLAHWNRGHFDSPSVRALVVELERFVAEVGQSLTRVAIRTTLGLWRLDQGDLSGAEAHLRKADEELSLPGDQRRGSVAINLAIVRIRQGDTLAAERYLHRFDNLQAFHGLPVNYMADAVRVFVAIEQGRLGDAAPIVDELERVDLSFPFASNASIIPEARAEFLRRTGRKAKAVNLLREASTTMARANVPASERLRIRAKELAFAV
jgi:hypothetical protein